MPDFGIFRGFNEKLFGDKLVAGQLPTELGFIGSDDFGIDSDYKAILDYANTRGYTLPSSSQQLLQSQLVVDLKDAGVWSKLDTFYVFATDGDSDFASINWKDPSNFEITKVNSPTFTTNVGFTGNGSSAYLDCNINPSTQGVNWSNPNGSFGFHQTQQTSLNGNALMGFADAITQRRKASGRTDIQGTQFGNRVLSTNNVFVHINQNTTIAQEFHDGSQVESVSRGTYAATTSMRILSGGGSLADATISMGFIGGDLSSEASDLYTAYYTNYYTSL